jgi:hypothetical protein
MKEVLGYKRFDRHACFTPEMMHMTMDVINEVEDTSLSNKVYGIFDGYLYSDLLETATKVGVSVETENKIKGLIKAIEMYLQLTSTKKNEK